MKFLPKLRGGHWTVDVTWPDGIRTRMRRRNEDAAGELAIRVEAAHLEGTWSALREHLQAPKYPARPAALVPTLADLCEIYLSDYCKARNKSFEGKRSRVRVLAGELGTLRVALFKLCHAEAYITRRLARGVKNATVNRDLTVLRHMFTWARARGYVAGEPLAKLRLLPESQWEGERPTTAIIDAVFSHLEPIALPLFVFIRETACRRAEALRLERWQVDVAGRNVLFAAARTKSGKSRRIPLSDEALAAVSIMPPLTKWVFYNPDTLKPWDTCKTPWRRAREAAGYPWLRIHDLRRALAIRAAEAGASMHDLKAFLGHSTVTLTEKYYAQFAPDQATIRVLRVLKGGAS